VTHAPRIIVVGRGAPERGGIPTFLSQLVQSQGLLGHEVVLVNLTPNQVVAGGRASVSNMIRALADSWRVYRTARKGDIVHIHSALAPSVTALRAGLMVRAGRLRGAHPVVHAHGGRVIGSLTVRRRLIALRWALAQADLVVAVSTRVADTLREAGVDPNRVRHLPNGIAIHQFSTRPPPASAVPVGDSTEPRVSPAASPCVLFVGGLTPRKGVLDLFAVSSRLLDEGVEHDLWLAGGLPDEGEGARRQVLEAAPAHAVLVGQVPPENMPELYAGADIFCLPSWWEAMPFTVLEAQAAGLPVVATDVGDVATVVLDGVTGRVVPPKDQAALAAALRELLTDANLRSRMGEHARMRAQEHFDLDGTLAELSRLFEEVWGATRRDPRLKARRRHGAGSPLRKESK